MYESMLKLPSVKTSLIQHRRITVLGAGKALCVDLIPQLITIKELWLTHGIIINLYDEPGCYFKIKRIVQDMEAIGGGLYAARIIDNISDGLYDCDILINLDVISKYVFVFFNFFLKSLKYILR